MWRAVLSGLFSLAIVAGLGILFVYSEIQRAGPATSPVTVVIEQGTGMRGMALQMAGAGAVRWSGWFIAAAIAPSDDARPLQAGEYEIPAGASAKAIVDLLRAGKVVVRRLTVPEGLTVAEILRIVELETALTGSLPSKPPDEGSLLPETYYYTRGETRAAMVDRMTKAMKEVVAAAWAARSANLPFSTPAEAVTLASIVEKETHVAGERAHVAGVFVNRLRRGMRLQTDPTVIYGITKGSGPLGRPLSGTDLRTETGYNTYLIGGLPPGPICNPGAQSILAAVRPLKTNDLYFVASGNGGHLFAPTLDEHNANVRAWRQRAASQ